MSVDIVPILSKCDKVNEKQLLSQLLPRASKSSLQSYLNSLLGKCDHIHRLQVLQLILKQSPEVCRENGEKLIPILNKILQRPGVGSDVQDAVFHCLSLVIETSLNNTDTSKSISSSAPSVINTILSTNSNSGLSLLAMLMTRYPGSCGQARPRILDMLVSRLSSRTNLRLLGKCFTLLCQVGGGGREGVEHTAHYNTMVATLISSIHTGLNNVFEGIRELDNHTDIVKLATPIKLNDSNTEQLAWQLDTMFGVLGEMLVRGFPQTRRVPVDSILSLPVRLLGLNIDQTKVNTPHQQLVSSLHSLLCCSSLKMTSDLITCLGDQLIPEAARINSLILSGISRTRDNARVRTELCTLLSTWLEKTGSGSGLEYCVGQIVTSLVKDIVPSSQKMILQTSQTSSKKGKKRKGGNNNAAITANSTTSVGDINNNDVAEAAIKVMTQIVVNVGPWLDKETHSKITKCVLTQLLTLEDDCPLVSGLVSCLHKLVILPSPHHLSPIQITAPIISKLVSNPSLSIQARDALLSLQTLCHPARSSLDIRDCKTSTLESLNEVVEEEDAEDETETEVASTFTQTDLLESNGNGVFKEQQNNKLKELEEALEKTKRAEAAVRAELMKKEIELSRVKILAEKRSLESCRGANDNDIAIKKPKIVEKVEIINSNKMNGEIFEQDQELGEDQLSVDDMLKDFSDKLNKNIIPKFTQDSDSD